MSTEASRDSSRFQLDVAALDRLSNSRRTKDVAELGGVQGIMEKLCTSTDGLSQIDIDDGCSERYQLFGRNVYPQPKSKSFIRLWLECLKDPILIILIISAVISFVLSFIPKEDEGSEGNWDWIEGVAILAAIVIVCTVTAFNDWSKERQFRKLNAAKEDRMVTVIRTGLQQTVNIHDLAVGDVVDIQQGDQVPADGILIAAINLELDESALTGESVTVTKDANSPFMLCGCTIATGNGTMVVTNVGIHSEWGKTLASLVKEPEPTPLQNKLDSLAKLIGYFGAGTALFTVLVLGIRWAYKEIVKKVIVDGGSFALSSLTAWIDFIILAVTIVVVAVPEGLPLAVTISLAYSMKRMMKDNNLVRHLNACETMGGATNICSDKTGTLTQNKMTVTQGWFAGRLFDRVPARDELPASIVAHIGVGSAVNSNAFLQANEAGQMEFIGSKTECALLQLSRNWGLDYVPVRKATSEITEYDFNSDRKRMSKVVDMTQSSYEEAARDFPDFTAHAGPRIFCKGASEMVLSLCTSYLDEQGQVAPMTEEVRKSIDEAIITLASNGLRTIILAYRDIEPGQTPEQLNDSDLNEKELTCVGLTGIMDPLREEVPESVRRCQMAGIMVRMVTGDNILTAKSIARSCNILTETGTAITGPELRRMTDAELDAVIPTLQVVARSTPTDKLKLVTRLRALGEVVAVTGDGANDAPALKEADVGLAMGISGTEVAKEASDIILLDDNFHSVEMAILWGRAVYDNIRKFLQFQLTVNVVALVVAFTGALFLGESPLGAVQLLWVNLIMDTLAALALATEGPHEGLLKRKPYGRYESLISPDMWKNIAFQSVFQLVVLFVFMAILPDGNWANSSYLTDLPVLGSDFFYGGGTIAYRKDTIIFNTFVFSQLFNELNARKITWMDWNILQNIHKSPMFIIVMVLTVVLQVLIVTFGSYAVRVHLLEPQEWLYTIAIAFLSIPIGFVQHLVPIPPPLARFIERLTAPRRKKAKKGVVEAFSGSDSSSSSSSSSSASSSASSSDNEGDDHPHGVETNEVDYMASPSVVPGACDDPARPTAPGE
ncbi:calcium-translocating P-type ATPase [Carpediemonas membranifera]|uniref:Calcium-transporting ATPase n=1 Tax=Carpediemonas membranifera TaxID=201153 RepID=A0A8J6E6N1_9EUKA|nr:calcium-translocating P-type ATPase [Carpediemonas membranifera]|eukprot:KAG9389740.1 calcium-translocating P-type ATPase [Carpediemonas membranifera]